MIVNGVLICVLYAALPPEAQMLAFRPKPDGCSRKIILATNIAGECSYVMFHYWECKKKFSFFVLLYNPQRLP